ncbi:MAG: nucleotide sugar dehydrogenase [Candidatus Scalindua sp. AMX11]|nr:MAG: nucleotide sugar dehydrogenase [Candidatus Scalindua sp.]NOG83499.1 nucleotide sugar dehydrogenase [Planctomycetota bacterium]RZV72095.1 MAG: nucleotide sugar dehydrogenase [Candidatus Scalindua sp. SCAELEC01]TDE64354.1 MAG: nucleotide sugar dehydrogenase [Candidatus Scalindua sp. AMX11]GJQ59899.1 MAG: UDP-glucose 6-dehydrogenase [Candidatus Scalindua sp.]
MSNEKTILCIGAGYVGGPTMAMIALKNPDYKVIVVDINSERIKAWNSENLPIYEPGLLEVVHKVRDKNLFFSTDVDNSIREAHIIFVSVNTPTKTFGYGAGYASDLQYWEKTARQILKLSDTSKIIVEKSTLPVKTAEAMERILNSNNNGIIFDVLSNPEFLAEGTAIQDLENPDRVLVGSRSTESGLRARDKIAQLYSSWIDKEKILTSNVWSTELSKLAANAFLAQRISSINSIASLCEETGANVHEVAHAVGTDSRIGRKFLHASIGFGGSCFKKDIYNLVYLCRHYGLDEVADYWESVVKINKYQTERFVLKMLKSMFNTIAGKRIALFGFAFKANTGDTRESPAIYVTKKLLKEMANVAISDPKALENAKIELRDIKENVEYYSDPYEAVKNAHAIAVLTEWECYKTLDYKKIFDSMEKPAFIFDGRNTLPHKELFEMGFNVFPLGMPELSHF